MIGARLEKYTFDNLMAAALRRIPNTVDKREGSIIYDALAPAMMQLAEFYLELRNTELETYVLTATGEYLDARASEHGVNRLPATRAVKRTDFTIADGRPYDMPIGSRFSTIGISTLIYRVIGPYEDLNGVSVPGAYRLECETAGAAGNDYIGALTPISYLHGLASAAMTEIVVSGRDTETDTDLVARYLLEVNRVSFGGNIAQYDKELKVIDGVGDIQVYPVWNGGGTVKLSVVDNSYEPISDALLISLQNMIDPESASGQQGVGLGLAPIGHKVTVGRPTPTAIDISATVTLSSGTVSQAQPKIEEEIEAYLYALRKQWGVADEKNHYQLTVFQAQITAAILRAPGVVNATNVMINGNLADRVLAQTAELQETPIKGSVIINGG